MKFYHGTRNKDLKELTTDHRDGKIYLTDNYGLAFLYAASSLRFWDYDIASDKTIFREVAPNAFKKLYKNKPCYIFTCETDDFVKAEHSRSNHVYLATKNVRLGQCEVIPDAYEKLLQLERDEQIILRRQEDLTEEQKQSWKESAIRSFSPVIKECKEKYPEDYEGLIALFPELEIKEN